MDGLSVVVCSTRQRVSCQYYIQLLKRERDHWIQLLKRERDH
jgi:hypothetical protein